MKPKVDIKFKLNQIIKNKIEKQIKKNIQKIKD